MNAFQRRKVNLLLDWIALFSGFAAFSTGLIMLTRFHMGDGVFMTEAYGIGRLVWLNIHRFSAAVMALSLLLHIWLHWRAFCSRFAVYFSKKRKKLVDSELTLYFTFFISGITGFAAWLILSGSTPLFGPLILERAEGIRHPFLDIHHLTSLVLLIFSVHHFCHRWRLMFRRSATGKEVQTKRTSPWAREAEVKS